MNQMIIVGAGIAGLTLALSLHKKGFRVKVYESAKTIEPLGVGLNLQPYAMKVFAELGLLEKLQENAVTTQEMVFFNRYGQRLHSLPLGLRNGHSVPQLSIHRGVLQQTLLDAARQRLGADFLLTGHTLRDVVQDDQGVIATFSQGPQAPLVQVHCSALIGADGVRSQVCRSLFGEHLAPVDRAVHMWRGVTVAPPFLSGASMVRIGVPAHGKLVIYPIRDQVNERGEQLINWVAELDRALFEHDPEFAPDRLEDLARFFASRSFDWLDIPQLLMRSNQPIIQTPMADRDPLPRWTVGRITLIGDAAHPMVPVGSNGAGQAILDAHCLAEALASGDSLEQALQQYEAQRKPLTSAIVLGDREELPDALIHEADRRADGLPFADFDALMSFAEARRLALPDYASVTQTNTPRTTCA